MAEWGTLRNISDEEALSKLNAFIEEHKAAFQFPQLTKGTRMAIVTAVISVLQKPNVSATVRSTGLQVLRILSRDKMQLSALVNDDSLEELIRQAALVAYAEWDSVGTPATVEATEVPVVVEAQKCLCNLVFNSQEAQVFCSNEESFLKGLVQRLKTFGDPELSHEIKFYDMRLLFLITALVSDTRKKLLVEYHAFLYLMEVIELVIKDVQEKKVPLSVTQVDLVDEVLKILFNIGTVVNRQSLSEAEEGHYMRLVSFLHDLLLAPVQTPEKRHEMHNHIVNLLTAMPSSSYEELLTPVTAQVMAQSPESAQGASGGADGPESPGTIVDERDFEGSNVQAIACLLEFLDARLKGEKNLKDVVTPILHCLCELCRSHRVIRRYCRLRVLPYMKDEVKKLPQDGTTLRNKLCGQLTSPCIEVKDLSARFLFILCKENVNRLIKYTGFGHAAGFLAERGLLAGAPRPDIYSSDSDSDTDEYIPLKEQVNPVTGRVEPDHPSPFEGMTEEQKEYEAVKLINAMDKLMKQGVIQPSTVGADGRPHPVEHVLQLQGGVKPPGTDEKSAEKESDDDDDVTP